MIVDVYPLTPLQHGMLFHHLRAPSSGVDVEQMVGTLREPLDVAAFERAWNEIGARHPILRTRFRWEGVEAPVQEVLAEAIVPYAHTDLRALGPEAQEAAITRYLAEDRRRGFDFAAAPLFRVATFQIGDEEHRLVWTYSHAILDGCVTFVLREVFAVYEARRRGEAPVLEERRPYRDHIKWLGEHLRETEPASRAFFSELLRGVEAQPGLDALARAVPDESLPGYGAMPFRLSRATSDALRAFADANALNVPVFIEAAWAHVLATFSSDSGSGAGRDDVVFGTTRACRRSSVEGAEATIGFFINTLPIRAVLAADGEVLTLLQRLRAHQKALRPHEHVGLVEVASWSELPRGAKLFDTIVVINDLHNDTRLKKLGGAWATRDFDWHDQTDSAVSLMAYCDDELHFKLSYDRSRFDDRAMRRVADLVLLTIEAMVAQPHARLDTLPRMTAREAEELAVLEEGPRVQVTGPRCVHHAFEEQVDRSPDAVALVFGDRSITYRALDERANRVADALRALGVGPDVVVGIFVPRSIEMMIGLLGILKAGGAYLPLDPAYPRERVAMMVEDTKAAVIVTVDSLRAALPAHGGRTLALDAPELAAPLPRRTDAGATGESLAYVIFTSGSTGRPKGAMIEHRNVLNFFAGMDAVLGGVPGVWLAVTSISFDISVLELFWTLARGYEVVLQRELSGGGEASTTPSKKRARPIDFSLFYFAADAGDSAVGAAKYRLLLEGAKFADANGFSAVWTPERHFHPFGGLYPNPSVIAAALATITTRIALRAGSVVLPLHNPIRCAEEWSVVDNLSNGRVGLSFASGWHARDFALAPDHFADRRRLMAEGIETIRALFRGEAVPAKSGDGSAITVTMYPPSVQRTPPIWVTAGGTPETFAMAGRIGANILTNLLVMSADDLVKNIAVYRAAYAAAGHPGEGHVTVMLHTFVGRDLDEVRAKVRGPFLEYLRTSTDLVNKARWELTAFAKADQQRAPTDGARDLDGLSKEDMDAILDHAFERYFHAAGLFGTPETCRATIDRLSLMGVDEVACLVDFGVDEASVLASLVPLCELKDAVNREDEATPPAVVADIPIGDQIVRRGVTHLQCTPSLAAILAREPATLSALAKLDTLLLGGEAVPPALVARLRTAFTGRMLDMYGPTETTIWSTSSTIGGGDDPVTLGRPIVNTRVAVVDRALRRVPLGVPGELLIGGEGVVRGYLDRPDLTAARFVVDPATSTRMYRTGDLAKFLPDGSLAFLGRIDNQVKVRGHRVELGEIEACLGAHPAIREAAVVATKEGSEDVRLIAYVVPAESPAEGAHDTGAWRAIWDNAYEEKALDATFNVSGWRSSFTGEPIPEAQMREWVERSVERILELGPRRVLEIGCGTGLLLFRVAPQCEQYTGVDFSRQALALVEAELPKRGLSQVTLLQGNADELPSLTPGSFDTIVLSSVVQYFPDAGYLERVVRRALELLAPGGSLFVGDVRSKALLPAFHAAVELAKAPATLANDELARRVAARAAGETELVIDPALFHAVAARDGSVEGISVRLKAGAGDDELTRFRYDVVLRKKGGKARASIVGDARTLEAPTTLDEVRRALDSDSGSLRLVSIANPRVARDVRAASQVASGATATEIAAETGAPEGLDPEALRTLDSRYVVDVTFARDGAIDRYDAVIRLRGADGGPAFSLPELSLADAALSSFTNAPARRAPALAGELRAHVRATLPDYMVPTAFVSLERLPLTPNGKLDRARLPAPDRARVESASAYVAPAGDTEEKIAAVWRDLLGIDHVGVDHRFFDLGGNSLMMVQAEGRLRAALGRSVSIVELFRFPTVRGLAAHLDASSGGDNAAVQGEANDRARARRDGLRRRRELREGAE